MNSRESQLHPIRFSAAQSSAPFLVKSPADQYVRIGDEATFVVVPGGTAPFTYQWQFEGQDIPAATNNVLTISNVQLGNLGSYSVLVGNNLGTVADQARLLLIPPMLSTFSVDPDNTLRFLVEGESGLSYTIEVSTNLIDWTVLTNIVMEGGSAQVIDSVSSNQTMRIYRARWNQ